MAASSRTVETDGVRIAVEGCGHGTLNAIYAAVDRACKERGWKGVDLVIIGGDFQAVRNADDLSVMSVPAKYRQMGDFHEYYSGARKAPYLTIFVAGNHEASAHLWELYYGGWVAPNIYYMGAANVLRLGPLRIAGLSGIWKGFDYKKPHHERLPFNADDIKSFYHVREIDVRKLLQLRTQVDIGISHDWPRAIEKHGNTKRLFKMKPDFRRESNEGTLGNPAAAYVLDRLRPRYWFSAHLHCKFSAIKTFEPPKQGAESTPGDAQPTPTPTPAPAPAPAAAANPDEIDLDLDGDEDAAGDAAAAADTAADTAPAPSAAAADAPAETKPAGAGEEASTEELRAQLPASFAKPDAAAAKQQPQTTPGQPVPAGITNTTTRFLALDKCLPGRKFLQLMEIPPAAQGQQQDRNEAAKRAPRHRRPFRLHYDPEWLAIVRVFHPLLTIGDRSAVTPPDEGEAHYLRLIEESEAWVREHVASSPSGLAVPDNFAPTAPPYRPGDRIDVHAVQQPREYTNPQTAAFCKMLGLENLWDATEEERQARREQGPAPAEFRAKGEDAEEADAAGEGGGRGGGRGRGRGR